jgi:tetratricopeptide (TPR) repeat protein
LYSYLFRGVLIAVSLASIAFSADSKLDSLISDEHHARDQKQWADAERLGAEAIKKAAEAGPLSADCANAVKELAITYLSERKYAQAEPVFLRAAAIGELAAISVPVLADTYYGAGFVQNAQNKRKEAEVSLRKALLLLEKSAGSASPKLCATLRELGLALNGLQKRDEAISTLQRCLKIQQGLPKDKQLDAVNTESLLADIFTNAGQLKEAEDYLRQALSGRESISGTSDPSLVPILLRLGDVLRRRGQRDKEAEEILRRALALNDKIPSPNLSDSVWIRNDLALALENQNRLDEAESLLFQSLDMSDKRGGESVETSRILGNLAALYMRQSRLPEAERLAARALTLREQTLGSDSTGVVSEMNVLARVYNAEGRFEDATKLNQRAYDIYTKSLGPSAPLTISAARSLSGSLDLEHHYSAAEEIARASLLAAEKRYGSDNLETALALEAVVSCLRSQGRLVEAEPLCLRAIAIRERQPGVKPLELSGAWNFLGILLRDKGHYAEALTMLKKAVDAAANDSMRSLYLSNLALAYLAEENLTLAENTLLKSMDLPDNENLPAHRLDRLGVLACARKQFAEGIPELEEAFKQSEKMNQPGLQALILKDLGNANRDKGDLDAAGGYYQKSLAVEKQPKLETLQLAVLYDNWGLLDLRQKKISDAEQHFLAAKRIFEKSVGSQSARTALCAYHLAQAYRAQNRFSEAEAMFRQSLAVERDEVSREAPILQRIVNDFADCLQTQHRDAEAKQVLNMATKRNEIGAATLTSRLPFADAKAVSVEMLPAYTGKTQVKAPFGNFSIWIDSAKWKQTHSSKSGQLTFSNIDGISQAVLMSEKIGAPLAALKDAVMSNFQKASPDVKVISEQHVKLNGKELLMMELDASINQMPYRSLGYFFGGKSGTVQLIVMTFKDVYNENLPQLRDFANGLQVDDDPMDPLSSRKVLTVNDGKASIAYDTTKWVEIPSHQAGKIAFSSTSGDGFAAVTCEKIFVPFERLPDVAFLNLRNQDANARLILKEKRQINGTPVWFLKIEASPGGIPLVLLQYLYSAAEGTVQVAAGTGRNLIESKEPDLLGFLAGFQTSGK